MEVEASGGKEKTGLRTGHEYVLIYHNGDGTCIAQTEISTGVLDREDSIQKGPRIEEMGRYFLSSGSSRAVVPFADP